MNGRGGLAMGLAAACGVLLAVWLGWPSAPPPAASLPAEQAAAGGVKGERSRARSAPVPQSRADLSSTAKMDAVRSRALVAPSLDSPAAKVVQPLWADLRACYDAARAHETDRVAGGQTVSLVLEVTPRGDGAGEITSVRSALGGSFDTCAARLLLGGRLPASEPTTVRYPLEF